MRYVVVYLFCFLAARAFAAETANLSGEYVDEKFLNGHGTIHVTMTQKGNDVSISFHGFHNDTPEVGVRFTATGKILPGDGVHFKFDDSCKNSGDGVIFRGKYRLRDRLKVSIGVDHIGDFSCLVFYQNNIELKPEKE